MRRGGPGRVPRVQALTGWCLGPGILGGRLALAGARGLGGGAGGARALALTRRWRARVSANPEIILSQ